MFKTNRFFVILFFVTLKFYSYQASGRLTYGTLFLVATPKELTDANKKEKNFSKMTFSVSTSLLEPFKVTMECNICSESKDKMVSRNIVSAINFNKDEIKNSIYKLSSVNREHLFTLCVRAVMNRDSIDTYLALPVDEWGTEYFCASLESQPFWALIISPVNANIIEININDSSSRTIKLNSYSHHREEIPASSVVSFTAHTAIGVIVGSSTWSHKRCPKGIQDNFLAEMLMPSRMFGTDFFTVHFENETNNGYIMIVVREDKTSVKFRNSSRDDSQTVIFAKYSQEIIVLDEYYYRITSDKPIQVFYYRRFTCLGHEQPVGASVLSIVVPTELFYYSYLVSKLKSTTFDTKLLIISEALYTSLISFDEAAISLHPVFPVKDEPDWLAIHVVLPKGTQLVYSRAKVRFGCYIYTLERNVVSIMNPAGYIASSLDTKNCLQGNGKAGDLVDNDCDGKIDEEILDQKDNDGDGTIDEDHMNLTEAQIAERIERNVKSEWTQWSDWKCPRECNATHLFRLRQCSRRSEKSIDCIGNSNETKLGTCNVDNDTCPLDCPTSMWNYGCKDHCENCVKDCDKYTGECTACQEGYKFPKQGCNQGCAAFEFGKDCLGDCLRKCWGDCEDRKTGACHGEKMTYIIMVGAPGLVVVGFMYIYCQKMKKFTNENSESMHRNTLFSKFRRGKSMSVGSALTDATTPSVDTDRSSLS